MNKLKILNDAQKKLIAEHTDIVKWSIYDYIQVNENIYGLGYDELFQEGCVCLCRAAATYDGNLAQFDTYAQVVVKNGLFTYCKKMCGKQKNMVHMDEIPFDSNDNGSDMIGYADNDVYDDLISDSVIFDLLGSVKSEYKGVTRLGIEALELKVKGYTGAEIARLWGVKQNHIGAWITRAKKKLRQNEQFMAKLQA